MSSNYEKLFKRAVELLGSERAVSRQLGLGHTTVRWRIEHNQVKREHELAMEHLVQRITRTSVIRYHNLYGKAS